MWWMFLDTGLAQTLILHSLAASSAVVTPTPVGLAYERIDETIRVKPQRFLQLLTEMNCGAAPQGPTAAASLGAKPDRNCV